jgi:hypothetical protein
MKPVRILAAATLIAAAALVGPAGAQEQQPPTEPPSGAMMGNGPGRGMMGGGMGPGMMMGWHGSDREACGAMAGHIDGRLAYVKAELKITDAQEPLWQAYATAVRDKGASMQASCGSMMRGRGAAALSLPDRLDQREKLMAAHLDAVRAVDAALKPLYAALSDSQKQAAEQLFRGPMGMM